MDKKDRIRSTDRRRIMPARLLIFAMGVFFVYGLFASVFEPPPAVSENSRLRYLVIDGYFDPARNFLDAKARLRFAEPARERRLWLAEELVLGSVSCLAMGRLDCKRDSGWLFVQSPDEEEMELCYSGRLARNPDPTDASGEADLTESHSPFEDQCLLSYVNNFYPQPPLDFTPLRINIRVPNEWNCLGSGAVLEVKPEPACQSYLLDNMGAKGMALVFGRFRLLRLIEGIIPIRLYGWPSFSGKGFLDGVEMSRALSFFSGRFGSLDLPALNILIRDGRSYYGVSYRGLIVLNVDSERARFPAASGGKTRSQSSLLMIDVETDLLVHELAHQWWGGMVSWETSGEKWISEGLATYSSLICLREYHGEQAYRTVIGRLRRQADRYALKGFPAMGYSFRTRNRDFSAYQALVYVKPALMLAALADKVGEKELCLRLRAILAARRFCNLEGREFLRLLSAGDADVNAQLNKWIFKEGFLKDLAV